MTTHASDKDIEEDVHVDHPSDVESANKDKEDKPTSCFYKTGIITEPPMQRQKWGQKEMLPHVNWGDLFFDLFYVAAAYNLATVIKYDPNWMGIFYMLALFFPVFANFWQLKMFYDSKFQIPNDLFHRGLEVISLCALATSVMNIQPMKYMSHGSDEPELFLFCLGNIISLAVHAILLGEIRFFRVDDKDGPVPFNGPARLAAGGDLRKNILPNFLFSLAAFIWATYLFYHDNNDSSSSSSGGDYHIRQLAGASSYGQAQHGPILLLLLGWASRPLVKFFSINFSNNRSKDYKLITIPMNVNFIIHRHGEYTMLMLGESILSLLIVNDVSTSSQTEYYFTFYIGILSVSLLQYLFYKSQPHSPEHHAMRRTRNAELLFNVMIQIYSAALIVVGVSYKLMLMEYTSSNELLAARRLAESTNTDCRRMLGEQVMDTNSSSADPCDYDTLLSVQNHRRQAIAYLFCFGLGISFFILDIMILSHNGINIIHHRCHCKEGKMYITGVIMVVISRISVTIALMVVSPFVNEPVYIALMGLIAVVLQIITRILGDIYFPRISLAFEVIACEFSGRGIEEEREIVVWPNTSQPQTVDESAVAVPVKGTKQVIDLDKVHTYSEEREIFVWPNTSQPQTVDESAVTVPVEEGDMHVIDLDKVHTYSMLK